jgi:signal transduction histidine kinase
VFSIPPANTYKFHRAATIDQADTLLRTAIELLSPDQLESGLVIDLSSVELVDSFGLTLLASCFNGLVTANVHGFVRPPHHPLTHNELLNAGLYEAIGIDRFGPRKPRRDRVDIVHITELQPGFIDHLLDFLESVQPFEEGLRDSMRMALLELIQNFSEHSRSAQGAWVVGQFDSVEKRIELCVLDLGIGIPNSLRALTRYRSFGDESLIENATRLGVSSTSGSRGLGLNTIRRFVAANEGTLIVLAGSGLVKFEARNAPTRRKLRARFPGTAVFMSLVPTKRGLFVL